MTDSKNAEKTALHKADADRIACEAIPHANTTEQIVQRNLLSLLYFGIAHKENCATCKKCGKSGIYGFRCCSEYHFQ